MIDYALVILLMLLHFLEEFSYLYLFWLVFVLQYVAQVLFLLGCLP